MEKKNSINYLNFYDVRLAYFTAKRCIKKATSDIIDGNAQLNCKLVSILVKAIIACAKA